MDLSPLKPQEWLDEDIGWRRLMIEARNVYDEERARIMTRKKARIDAQATAQVNARQRHG